MVLSKSKLAWFVVSIEFHRSCIRILPKSSPLIYDHIRHILNTKAANAYLLHSTLALTNIYYVLTSYTWFTCILFIIHCPYLYYKLLTLYKSNKDIRFIGCNMVCTCRPVSFDLQLQHITCIPCPCTCYVSFAWCYISIVCSSIFCLLSVFT